MARIMEAVQADDDEALTRELQRLREGGAPLPRELALTLVDRYPGFFFLIPEVFAREAGSRAVALMQEAGRLGCATWAACWGARIQVHERVERAVAATRIVRAFVASERELELSPRGMPDPRREGFVGEVWARLVAGVGNREATGHLLAWLLTAAGEQVALRDAPQERRAVVVIRGAAPGGGDVLADAWRGELLVPAGAGEPRVIRVERAGRARGEPARAFQDLVDRADPLHPLTRVAAPAASRSRASPPGRDARRRYLFARARALAGDESRTAYAALLRDRWVAADLRARARCFLARGGLLGEREGGGAAEDVTTTASAVLRERLRPRYRVRAVALEAARLVATLAIRMNSGDVVELQINLEWGGAGRWPARVGDIGVSYSLRAETLPDRVGVAIARDVASRLRPAASRLSALRQAATRASERDDAAAESTDAADRDVSPDRIIAARTSLLERGAPEDRASVALALMARRRWREAAALLGPDTVDPMAAGVPEVLAAGVLAGALGRGAELAALLDRLTSDASTPRRALAALAFAERRPWTALRWLPAPTRGEDWLTLRTYLEAAGRRPQTEGFDGGELLDGLRACLESAPRRPELDEGARSLPAALRRLGADAALAAWVEGCRRRGDHALADRWARRREDAGSTEQVQEDRSARAASRPRARAETVEAALERLERDADGPDAARWSAAAETVLRSEDELAATRPDALMWHRYQLFAPPARAPIIGRPRAARQLARDFLDAGGALRLRGALDRGRVAWWRQHGVQRIREGAPWIKEPEHVDALARFELEQPGTWPRSRVTFTGDRAVHLASLGALGPAIDVLVGGRERLVAPAIRNAAIYSPGFLEHRRRNLRGIGWHVDDTSRRARLGGHRLAILLIVLLEDIEDGFGTGLALGSPAGLARRLAEGGELDTEDDRVAKSVARGCAHRTAHGRAGDVYLLHPWMVHGAIGTLRGQLRVLSNPGLFQREPLYRAEGPRSPVEELIHDALA